MVMTTRQFFAAERREARKRLCAKRLFQIEEMRDGIHKDMLLKGDLTGLMQKASTSIQAARRGMMVRRTASRKIAMARAKIIAATERAEADPSQVLLVKVKVALQSLDRSKRLPAITQACSVLELASRYSGVCCQKIAEGRGPCSLYKLLRGLNRSPPHEIIRTDVLRILRNIALEASPLAVMIAAPRAAVATLVDLAQNFPHRQEVFLPTVRLLRQLVEARQPTMDACNRPLISKRLKDVRTTIARRTAEEAKRGDRARTNAPTKRYSKSLRAVDLLFEELSRE